MPMKLHCPQLSIPKLWRLSRDTRTAATSLWIKVCRALPYAGAMHGPAIDGLVHVDVAVTDLYVEAAF